MSFGEEYISESIESTKVLQAKGNQSVSFRGISGYAYSELLE